jgi:histidinol-phosphate aminotransferase
MAEFVAGHIETLTPYPPGKPIEEVERELGVVGSLKVASNENPLGPSPRAVEAIAAAAAHLNIYPDGGGWYLKSKLSERFGFDRSQIMLGNGSNELLDLIIRTFMSVPGLNAVTSETTFVVYKLVMQACGRELREAPLADDYGYDLGAMLRLVDERTRLIFIANPNNPTGSYISGSALDRFIEAVDERCAGDPPILVLDEAYQEYADAEDFPQSLELVHERPRTVVLRTFSKAYGLAGLRCGYGFASAEVVDYLNRVRQPFNVNSLALAGALAALDDEAFLEHVVAVNREGKAWLAAELASRGLTPVDTQANFLLVEFGRQTLPIYQALMRQGVIVRPMGGYGLPTCLRITVASPEGNQRIIDALDAVL